jgi:hypothetical protein
VDVAQLVRVADCGSVGRGFESHLPPKIQKPVLGREPVFLFSSVKCLLAKVKKKKSGWHAEHLKRFLYFGYLH